MLLYFFFIWTSFSVVAPNPYGPIHNGCQLAYSNPTYYLLNEKAEIIGEVIKLKPDLNAVIAEIKKSTIADKDIIARTLEMQRTDKARYIETMYMSQHNNEIALIVLKELERVLNK